MMNLLAQVANGNNAETAYMIGTAVGTAILILGGREGVEAIKRRRTNGNGYNKQLCDERHARIDRDMGALFGKIDGIHEKLDIIQRDINGHKKE